MPNDFRFHIFDIRAQIYDERKSVLSRGSKKRNLGRREPSLFVELCLLFAENFDFRGERKGEPLRWQCRRCKPVVT